MSAAHIIARSEHTLSRSQISENALKVLYRLKNAGFEAYLVGGSVRDLLLGRKPKDFDVATDATPEQVRQLFRNCRLIGRRFRLAHVHFGPEIIEVATFRGQHQGEQGDERQIVNGMIVRDNVYGTLEEDAWRRDFRVNSLYYNIRDFSVVDLVGGMEDLRQRVLRLIGDPETRYREDPVRMLRAIRFAAKLDFELAPETAAPLHELGHLLEGVPPARLFEEMLKLFMSGHGVKTLNLMREFRLCSYLFPQTEECLEHDHDSVFAHFIERVLENTDQRIAEDKPVTPMFLLASFLWQPVQQLRARFIDRGMSKSQALMAAADSVLSGQAQRVAVPRRFQTAVKEVWQMQDRLENRQPKRSLRLVQHPRFRAGYDFLLLRSQVGDADPGLAHWWDALYHASESERDKLVESLGQGKRPRRRRRRRAKKSD